MSRRSEASHGEVRVPLSGLIILWPSVKCCNYQWQGRWKSKTLTNINQPSTLLEMTYSLAIIFRTRGVLSLKTVYLGWMSFSSSKRIKVGISVHNQYLHATSRISPLLVKSWNMDLYHIPHGNHDLKKDTHGSRR